MDRREFLATLRGQLEAGQMHEGKRAAHLRYYEDYIQSRVRSGQSEEEVIRALGDPRLIARTLLDTDDRSAVYEDDSDHYKSYSDAYGTPRQDEPATDQSAFGRIKETLSGILHPGTRTGRLLRYALAFLAVFLVIRLLLAAIPFLIALAVVVFAVSYFSKK